MIQHDFIPLDASNRTPTCSAGQNEETIVLPTDQPEIVPWSTLIRHLVPISLLSLIYFIVDSALMLLIPLHTESKFEAGLIVTCIGISTVISPPLVGQAITRTSTEFVLLLSSLVRTLSISALFYDSYFSTTNPSWLWITVAIIYGATVDGTRISVNHCIAKHFPVGNRGRATAIINGVRRLGPIIGPLYATQSDWNVHLPFTDFQLSLLITMAISFQSMTVVFALMTPPNGNARCNPINWVRNRNPNEREHSQRRLGIGYVWSRYLKLLLMISVLSCGLDWLRVTRKLILTFHGQDIGLDHGDIGYVNSISWIPDAMMFPVAGYVMDKYGRKATAIPGLILFIVALSLLPFARNYVELMAVSLGFGIGNGITCGLLMTVAADIAPSECKPDFIAGFRMFRNIPEVMGPIVISTLCSKVSLTSAAIGSAGIGGVSLLWTAFVIPEPKYYDAQKGVNRQDSM